MKSFIISIIIFFILLFLVIANAFYVHKICNEILELTFLISENDIDNANKLCNIWKKHEATFSISIHDSKIERLTELVENIKSAVTIGNGADLEKNVTLLRELLEELKKNEAISFQGII